MNLSLKHKHAFVCGSTDGIGKASALLLAEHGCEITLIARNQGKLDSTLLELAQNNGQNHSTVCADFYDPETLKERVNSQISTLGKPVDILVNNSGGPHGGALIEAEEDEFRIAFEWLLICNHIMAKAVVPGMKEQGSGRIINIISTSVRQVIPGLGVSNTIRGSVAQWGKTLAIELGEYGICVNNILPGATKTNRLDELIAKKASKNNWSEEKVAQKMKSVIPVGRFAEPRELGYLATFLCSDYASYINGINIPIDGGSTKSL